jgi:8-oxo-dGTP pyrophosphatase MutT (NUDIX family)
MHKPPTLKNLVSSGGVLFRKSDEVFEVALVSIRGSRVWSLPKGIIERDEDQETTAAREVMEETGLKGEILEKIGQIAYWYFQKEKTVKVHKTVHYFLMRYISGSTDDHDDEVDEARWVPLEDAFTTLNFRGEKEIMFKAKNMIDEMAKEV